jgi:hypothetical protein
MKGRTGFSRGQMLVLFTLVLPVLLGAIGLGADIGILYFNWVQLQKAADSAALAGAQYLASPAPSPQSAPTPGVGCPAGGDQVADAQSAACTYATYNGAQSSEVTSTVPAPNPPASVPAGAETIQVVLNRPNVPTYFLRFVGLSSLGVKTQAVAMAPTCINQAGNGLFPIGMPNVLPGGINLNDVPPSGTQVTLVEGTSPGNWEWLNIPPGYTAPTTDTATTNSGGNSQLASTITTGCVGCDVVIDSYLTPQTGGQGSSNGVATAIGDRIISSTNNVTITSSGSGGTWSNIGPPSLDSTQIPSGAQALVTVPIVNWTGSNGSSNPVEVFGFAVVWLDSYTRGGGSGSSSNPDSLTVTFLNVTSTIQTSGGPCVNKYPGLTQAELVQ